MIHSNRKKSHTSPLLLQITISALFFFHGAFLPPKSIADIQAPILKWQNAGCYTSWCETGWYSSPAVADLDHDGSLEIVVSAAIGSKTNTWIYEHNGQLRAGWPQLVGDSGYAYGVFNDNVALADIDGNGMVDIVVPSDVHYICAYDPGGLQLPANSIYGDEKIGSEDAVYSLQVISGLR